jgi:dienelactone hydrolase
LVLLAALLASGAVAAQEILMLPLQIDGEPVRMEVRVFKPQGNGPFPTLIFHHGSTGNGRNPQLFTNAYIPAELQGHFVGNGWVVALPSRRGRGGSEGTYDEGFNPDRTRGYTCDHFISLAGADRALRDVDAVTKAIIELPVVDKTRVVVGGQSRGGILAVAYAAQKPELFKGVVNFVGGWMGTGCPTATSINQDLFKRAAASPLPSIWLYGADDPFYSISHSRSNFATFEAAGGKGEFVEYPKPEHTSGHGIITRSAIWSRDVDRYLQKQGLAAR